MEREDAVLAVKAEVCSLIDEATENERDELRAGLDGLATLIDRLRARRAQRTAATVDELPPTVRHGAAEVA